MATIQSAHPVRAVVDRQLEDGQTYVHATLDVHRWAGVHVQAVSDEAVDVVLSWGMDGDTDLAALDHTTTLVPDVEANWHATPRARVMTIKVDNSSGNTATFSLDFYLNENTVPGTQLPLDADDDSVSARLQVYDGSAYQDVRGSNDGLLFVRAGHDGSNYRALATDGAGRVATEARCSGYDGGAWKALLTDGDGRVATQARLVGYDSDATAWRNVAVDADGKLLLAPEATTPASMAYSSAASTAPIALETGAGELHTILVNCADSWPAYIWLYDDDATNVDENTTPVAGFVCVNGSSMTFPFPAGHPWRYATGVCFRATQGAAHTDTTSPGAGTVHITIAFIPDP